MKKVYVIKQNGRIKLDRIATVIENNNWIIIPMFIGLYILGCIAEAII